MTLSGTPRYDVTLRSTVGSHAIVLGAGVSGILAARVLADRFERVTLFDRDLLPDEPVGRRSIPQAEHVHAMLEGGRSTLSDLFPGFEEAVHAEGGVSIDAGSELKYHHEGGFLANSPNRLPMLCASRPVFEQVIRRRVAALENVTLRPGHRFITYLIDRSESAVSGVRVQADDGRERDITANLVVDAMGRTSKTPRILENYGYSAPAIESVDVDLAYSTVRLERPPDDRRGFLIAPTPPILRGGTVIPVEGNQWMCTLFGLHGDHPPSTVSELSDFAESLPTSELHDLLETRPKASDTVNEYPFATSRWQRYDELDRFPERLIPIGDAIASFNPIYGQGMSVAALEALQLHHAIGDGGLSELAPRYFDRTANLLSIIWRMTVGSDFQFAETDGPRPIGTWLFNRYLTRLIRTGHADGRVTEAFARVHRLERHPISLFRPNILARVLRPTFLDRTNFAIVPLVRR